MVSVVTNVGFTLSCLPLGAVPNQIKHGHMYMVNTQLLNTKSLHHENKIVMMFKQLLMDVPPNLSGRSHVIYA